MQEIINKLFQDWLDTKNIYNNDLMILKGYKKFLAEMNKQFRTIKPIQLKTPEISKQFKIIKWIKNKSERPYSWDGELGLWFNDRLQTNNLPRGIIELWHTKFNFLNEYKEWVLKNGIEPTLKDFNDPNNCLGIKGGGELSKLEGKLARWANQIKEANISGQLTEGKYREIDERLGTMFNWSCIIDTIKNKKDNFKKRKL